jgi:hypothetical protein
MVGTHGKKYVMILAFWELYNYKVLSFHSDVLEDVLLG